MHIHLFYHEEHLNVFGLKDSEADLGFLERGFYQYFLKFPHDNEHTVHPDTTNAERSSKRGYKQLYRGNTQGKKTINKQHLNYSYIKCVSAELMQNGLS